MPVLELQKKNKRGGTTVVGSIEIHNQTETTADLCFFGDIISESLGEWKKYYPDEKAPNDVQDFLNQLNGVSRINVHINSGGGSVFGGIAIYNILKRYNAEIVVYIDGLAASIASVIAMAGDRIIIPSNAQMMIHKPSSFCWGNADDMRKEADILDGCQKVILNTYMEHVKDGVTAEQINGLIDAETWKNGEEWQEFFDVELSEKSFVAACDSEYYDKYKNLPNILQKNKSDGMDMDRFFDEIVKRLQEISDTKKQAAELLDDLDLI